MNSPKDLNYCEPTQIKRFQEERLRETIAYLKHHSPYYRRLFDEHHIDTDRIRTLEDLQCIPVTTKEDLQRHNMEFLCVSPREVRDYVTTSGTLGDPVTFALTESDLQRLAYNEYSSYFMAGCTCDDVIQLMTTIDRRFMAGLAYFLGSRQMGCAMVRVGNGMPELQWETIDRIKPTTCMVVPSFLIRMLSFAEQNGIDYHTSSLKKAICIGEALRQTDGTFTTLGRKINEKWPELELYSTYASTEMQTSFTECHKHCGGHQAVDLIIVEMLDEHNQPVPNGTPGEVTITNIGVTGMPLLRFKTGDICIRYGTPCDCGRFSPRLSSVIGRKGQMIKFKGTTIYPPALYDILDNIPQITNYVVEVFTNDIGTDQIQIRVGSRERSEAFVKQVKDIFRAKVRVAPDIKFESAEFIECMQNASGTRKSTKFFDLRKNT